jgi:TRAP-type mannitol/chloroaromatic compound transport system substrate-binding protein
MKRRQFLSGAGVAAGAFAATAAAPAIVKADETINWRMVMPWPKGTPGLGANGELFAERVNKMSGGRLNITVYGAGELVPALECMDAVEQGVADLAHATPYYWFGKDPAVSFFTTIPFGLMAWELSGWLRFGGGQALWDELYAQFNVKPFLAGNTGLQAGGWFNKEINSVEDLKGLKVRYAGIGGEAMRHLGATPSLLPAAEILPSLQSGAIDAAEWVGPWNDYAFGLASVAKYYYTPAFAEPGSGIEVFINKDKFAELPEDLQEIVAVAAQANVEQTLSDFTFNNVQSYQAILEKGTEIRHFNDDLINAFAGAARESVEEIAGQNELNGRIYASLTDFAKKAAPYGKEFEATALNQRANVFANASS